NVYRQGSLVQHIESAVNHAAGRKVPIAHDIAVEKGSLLERVVGDGNAASASVAVNSSHHQSAEALGQGLQTSPRCPVDGVIEAIEGTDPGHFVLAVQWHPERSVDDDAASRRIFRALVEAANAWRGPESK